MKNDIRDFFKKPAEAKSQEEKPLTVKYTAKKHRNLHSCKKNQKMGLLDIQRE